MPPDEKTEAEKEADLLKGSPQGELNAADEATKAAEAAAEAAKKAAAPEFVTVRYAGREYKVTKEVAGVMDAQATALAAATKTPPKQADETKKTEDFEDLLFSDPKRAKELIKQEIRDEMTSTYTADQAQRKFWNDFYVKNKDLDPAEDSLVVNAVLNKNFNDWKDLNADVVVDKLAEATRVEITRLTKKASGNRQLKPQSESGGTRQAAREEKAEPERTTLSATLAARRAARRPGARPTTVN